MERASLQRLVRQGEGLQLELKRKARHPDKIAREVVAFANTEGGTLLIGVDDDLTIYGCKFPDDDAFTLQKYFDEHLVPAIPYRLERIAVERRRQVLAFHIPASKNRPHFLIAHQGPGGKSSFVREADMSIKASREMIQILRHQNRDRGVKIQFGEAERTVLQYFEAHQNITLAQTQKLLKTSRRKSSELLIRLVRASILSIRPSIRGDYYELKESSFE